MEPTALEAQKLLEHLYDLQCKKSDPVPKGYYNAVQWAKALKIDKKTAQRKLKKGVKSGALKMLELNLYTSTGMRLVRYYSK